MSQAQNNVIHIVVSAEEKARFALEAKARKQSESRLGYGLLFQCTRGFEDFTPAGPPLKEVSIDACEDTCE